MHHQHHKIILALLYFKLALFSYPQSIDDYFLFDSTVSVVPINYEYSSFMEMNSGRKILTNYNSFLYYSWFDGNYYRYAMIDKDGNVIDSCIGSIKEIETQNFPEINIASNKYGVYTIIEKPYNTLGGKFFNNGELSLNNTCKFLYSGSVYSSDICGGDSTFLITYNASPQYHSDDIGFIYYKLIDKKGEVLSLSNNILESDISADVSVSFDGTNYYVLYLMDSKLVINKISEDGEVINRLEKDIGITYRKIYTSVNSTMGNENVIVSLGNKKADNMVIVVLDTAGTVLKNKTINLPGKYSSEYDPFQMQSAYKNGNLYFIYPQTERSKSVGRYDLKTDNVKLFNWSTDTITSNIINGIYSDENGVYVTSVYKGSYIQYKPVEARLYKIEDEQITLVTSTINIKYNASKLIGVGSYNNLFTSAIASDKSSSYFSYNLYDQNGNIQNSIRRDDDHLDVSKVKFVEGKDNVLFYGAFDSAGYFSVAKDASDSITTKYNRNLKLWSFKEGYGALALSKYHLYDGNGSKTKEIPTPATTYFIDTSAAMKRLTENYFSAVEGNKKLLLQFKKDTLPI